MLLLGHNPGPAIWPEMFRFLRAALRLDGERGWGSLAELGEAGAAREEEAKAGGERLEDPAGATLQSWPSPEPVSSCPGSSLLSGGGSSLVCP